MTPVYHMTLVSVDQVATTCGHPVSDHNLCPETATCERGFSTEPSARLVSDTSWQTLLDALMSDSWSLDRHEWTWYWISGRSEDATSGICQCVEELQEEDTVKDQYRCNRPIRNTQDRSNVYSQLSGLEHVVFNDFIKDDFRDRGADDWKTEIRMSLFSWSTGWVQVWHRNVFRECTYSCEHKNTEWTIYYTQLLHWVGSECGESLPTHDSFSLSPPFLTTVVVLEELNEKNTRVHLCPRV